MMAAVRERCAVLCRSDEGLTLLLSLLFIALMLGPFIDRLPTRPLSSLILCLVMVAGVAQLSRNTVTRLLAWGVALTAIVLRALTHLAPSPAILVWSAWASLLFMVLLSAVTLHNVFADDRPVTRARIRGAVACYLLLGITWSIVYTLTDLTIPGAFSLEAPGAERQERLVYFSFITLTTLGYGDITPRHDISRMFVITEALLGQLYPATLLARLVSLEVSHRDRNRDEKDPAGSSQGDGDAKRSAVAVQK